MEVKADAQGKGDSWKTFLYWKNKIPKKVSEKIGEKWIENELKKN